jgi:hypothetical protein
VVVLAARVVDGCVVDDGGILVVESSGGRVEDVVVDVSAGIDGSTLVELGIDAPEDVDVAASDCPPAPAELTRGLGHLYRPAHIGTYALPGHVTSSLPAGYALPA